jgi:integrase
MSLQGSKTKSDFIEWGTVQSLILKLERDKDLKFALLVAVGVYTGLRIGDVLSLRWNDLLERESLQVTEQKTKKGRKITINPQLQAIVRRVYGKQGGAEPDGLIFLNRWGTAAISRQYVNNKLKLIAAKYKVTKDPSAIKSHSLRKSFGRRVFENNDNSERSLILLSDILNHSSIKTTKIYLGIRDTEIADVYVNL